MHLVPLMTTLLPMTLALQGQTPTSTPPPDSEPAPTNVQGAQYPRITSDLRAIFRREAPYVWNTLRFLGVQERDLEDLTHDVFIVVHRRLGDYDPARPIRPWLFGIALRIAMRYRTLARHRVEVMPGSMVDIADDRPTPEVELRHAQARAVVASAIAELTEDHRAIFVLVELQGEAITEVAAGLDLPLNTVYSRLRRARAQFRDIVTRLRYDEEVRA